MTIGFVCGNLWSYRLFEVEDVLRHTMLCSPAPCAVVVIYITWEGFLQEQVPSSLGSFVHLFSSCDITGVSGGQ